MPKQEFSPLEPWQIDQINREKKKKEKEQQDRDRRRPSVEVPIPQPDPEKKPEEKPDRGVTIINPDGSEEKK